MVSKGASVFGAALSLAVTTMGAGILTLPSAYADAGIIPTSLLLVFVACVTVVSIDFMVQSIDKLGLNSYEEITRELLGRKAEELVRWMLLVYNIGSAIGYLVVIRDLFEPMQPMVQSFFPFLTTSKHTLFAFWALVIVPLSCIPKITKLHFTSMLAIAATCVISSMIVFRYFVPLEVNAESENAVVDAAANSNEAKDMSLLWWWGKQPLLALPIVMFSFDCQSLVFQIYGGLEDMRRRVMLQVSILSLIVSGTIHAAVGLFGYLANPHDVKDNIISNYDPNVDPLFAVGYVLYAIPINLSFVLMLFPIRDSIFILWYGFSSASVATHVPQREHYTRLVDEQETLEVLLDAKPEARKDVLRSLVGTPHNMSIALPNHSFTRSYALTDSQSRSHPTGPAPKALNYGTAAEAKPEAPTAHPAAFAAANAAQHHPEGESDRSFDSEELASPYLERDLELVQTQKKLRNEDEVIPYREHLLVTMTLNAVCIAGAIVLPGIVSVVALLGGVCSSTLCFTCPSLYRYQLEKRGLATTRHWWNRWMMWGMLAFGLVGGALGTIVSIAVFFL